jgi:succinate dehydrogenase / fumarate reductase iron-sulfur subunit
LARSARQRCVHAAVHAVRCGAVSYWWNPDRFLGPATLLQAMRFIADSRDRATEARLEFLDDAYRIFRCRTIMNCTEVCPKGLNPARAIEHIRQNMLKRTL